MNKPEKQITRYSHIIFNANHDCPLNLQALVDLVPEGISYKSVDLCVTSSATAHNGKAIYGISLPSYEENLMYEAQVLRYNKWREERLKELESEVAALKNDDERIVMIKTPCKGCGIRVSGETHPCRFNNELGLPGEECNCCDKCQGICYQDV